MNSLLLALKKNALPICALAFAFLTFSSCEKNTAEVKATEQEAMAVVSQAFRTDNGGLAFQAGMAMMLSASQAKPANCGLKKDTVFTARTTGADGSHGYNLNWSRLLTCSSSNVPLKFDHTFSGTTSFETTNFVSDGQTTGTATVLGLDAGTAEYVVSQRFTQKGSQRIKASQVLLLSSDLLVETTNLRVSKLGGQIIGGTGRVSITGSSATGAAFAHSGSLLFTGGNTATITLDGGGTHKISW
ncbi:hypothetical protein [Pedobacter sp. SYP-B3415]|uniref:hypothetical protein n=1 Tax=Pedobacter sp. SYP-B3415 TaxID=2496641 RepID=UPI00101D4259|nr:hypothetical protein [Pedobacter sp. SYP-B3415]